MRKLLACLLPAALLGLPLFVLADDGAASIAEGGIVIMKRETRITMAKEVLQISNSKVIVDYEFRSRRSDRCRLPDCYLYPRPRTG